LKAPLKWKEIFKSLSHILSLVDKAYELNGKDRRLKRVKTMLTSSASNLTMRGLVSSEKLISKGIPLGWRPVTPERLKQRLFGSILLIQLMQRDRGEIREPELIVQIIGEINRLRVQIEECGVETNEWGRRLIEG